MLFSFHFSKELEQVLLNKQSVHLILRNVISRGTRVSDKERGREQEQMQDCQKLSGLKCDVTDKLSLDTHMIWLDPRSQQTPVAVHLELCITTPNSQ